MIAFNAWGIAFKMPLITLLTPVLALRLGMKLQISTLFLGLFAHEAAHILAAKLSGVEILEIRLTPFGGSARMENPYGVAGARLFAVAIAGPAANLLCAVIFAALAQWRILLDATAAGFVKTNLTLFAFNLLPALPLDGGRMLFCILQKFTGGRRALRACLICSGIFAVGLASLAIFAFCSTGRLNLCLLLVALFITVSIHDERDAYTESAARRLIGRDRPNQPMCFYQMRADSGITDALKLLRPGAAGWFLLLENKKPAGLLDGRTIAEYLRSGGSIDTELGRLPLIRFMQE